MATRNLIVSMMQGKDKSAMSKAMDNANEFASKANSVGPKQKGKK